MEEREITNLMLLSLFRRCSHLQFHRLSRFQGQGRILGLLLEHGTLTQRALAELTQRRSATLSEQLERMEAAGLLLREKNCADKRNVDLRLTEAGVRLAREAERERRETADALFGFLDPADKQTLYRTLERLDARWTREAQGGEAEV